MGAWLLLGEKAAQGEVRARDIGGLVFIGVAILAIWLGFLHMQGLMDRSVNKVPVEPPPGKSPLEP